MLNNPRYQISSSYCIPMTQKRHLWFTDLDLDWEHMVDVWENVYVCFLMPLVGKSPEKKKYSQMSPQLKRIGLIWHYYTRRENLFLSLLLHAPISLRLTWDSITCIS